MFFDMLYPFRLGARSPGAMSGSGGSAKQDMQLPKLPGLDFHDPRVSSILVACLVPVLLVSVDSNRPLGERLDVTGIPFCGGIEGIRV